MMDMIEKAEKVLLAFALGFFTAWAMIQIFVWVVEKMLEMS